MSNLGAWCKSPEERIQKREKLKGEEITFFLLMKVILAQMDGCTNEPILSTATTSEAINELSIDSKQEVQWHNWVKNNKMVKDKNSS